jgi:hypothetical protein
MKQEKWYIGQKVWDETLKPGLVGVVALIITESSFPIIVKYGEYELSYTEEGSYLQGIAPTLRPYPHRITIERIEPEFEKGQIVLVRDESDKMWQAARFASKDCGYYYVTVRIDRQSVAFMQCIPFEGNEHLLLTTQEP